MKKVANFGQWLEYCSLPRFITKYRRRKQHKPNKQEVVLEATAQYFDRQVQLQDKRKKVKTESGRSKELTLIQKCITLPRNHCV